MSRCPQFVLLRLRVRKIPLFASSTKQSVERSPRSFERRFQLPLLSLQCHHDSAHFWCPGRALGLYWLSVGLSYLAGAYFASADKQWLTSFRVWRTYSSACSSCSKLTAWSRLYSYAALKDQGNIPRARLHHGTRNEAEFQAGPLPRPAFCCDLARIGLDVTMSTSRFG